MAKFCQNCRKTYSDSTVTFCEECGGDLVPLESGRDRGAPSITSGEEFVDEHPPQPLWRKYLPYGIGLAVLALFLGVAPGFVADDVHDNVTASIDRTQFPDALRIGEIPVKINNTSRFALKLRDLKLDGALRGMAIRPECTSTETPDVPKGGSVTVMVNLVNRCPGTDLKQQISATPDQPGGSLNAAAEFSALGVSVNHRFSWPIRDEDLRTAFNLKDRDAPKETEEPVRKPKLAATSHTKPRDQGDDAGSLVPTHAAENAASKLGHVVDQEAPHIRDELKKLGIESKPGTTKP